MRLRLWWGLAAILVACLAPVAAARPHGLRRQTNTSVAHAATEANLRTVSMITSSLQNSRRRLHGSSTAAAPAPQTELSEEFSVPATSILKPGEIPATDFAPYLNITYRIIGPDLLPVTSKLQTAVQRSFDSVYALFDFEFHVTIEPAVSAPVTTVASAVSTVGSSSPPAVALRPPPPRAAHRRLLQQALEWNATQAAQYQAVDATLLVGFTTRSSFLRSSAESRVQQRVMLQNALATFGLQTTFVVTSVGTTGPCGQNSQIVAQRLPADFITLNTSNYILNFLFEGDHVAPVSVEAQTALLKAVVAAMPAARTAKVTHVSETADGTQANVTMAVAMTESTGNSSAESYQQLLQTTLEDQKTSGNLGFTLRVIVLAQPPTIFKVAPGVANETFAVLPLSSFGVNETSGASDGGSSALPTGAIIAIVAAGTTILVLLVATLGFITLRQRKHSDGGVSPRKDGGLGGFDRRLQGFCISPEDIQICFHEDGTEWLLGEGAYGKVHKGLRGGVQDIAIKQLHDAEDGELEKFIEEVGILKGLNYDRNIVQFYGACIQPGADPMLIVEYMEGGDLCAAIAGDDGATLRWYDRGHRIALDIARGLYFLHSHDVLHGDIKTQNILLTSGLQAKIGDVGLASLADKKSDDAKALKWATFAYAAPEALFGEQCGLPADIYSFGIVLLEIVTGVMPHTRGKVPPPLVPEECPPEIWKLIQACTAFDPAARPTAKVCFNTLRVAVELLVAAGTITSPASQREYSTFRSATSQSMMTASSVPSKFATGSGSDASAVAEASNQPPAAGVANAAAPANGTVSAPPASATPGAAPPAAPSNISSPGGSLYVGSILQSSSCRSSTGAGHGHTRLMCLASDAAMNEALLAQLHTGRKLHRSSSSELGRGSGDSGFSTPLVTCSGARSDAAAEAIAETAACGAAAGTAAAGAAAPAADLAAAAPLDSRQSSASVDGACMYGAFQDAADDGATSVVVAHSSAAAGLPNPFAAVAAQRRRRSLEEQRTAAAAADATESGSGPQSRTERAQSMPASGRLPSPMETNDSALDRHGSGTAATKAAAKGSGADEDEPLERRTSLQWMQQTGSPMLEYYSAFRQQPGSEALAAGRFGLVDPSAFGDPAKLAAEAAEIQEFARASEAASAYARASGRSACTRSTRSFMSARSQLSGGLAPVADHASSHAFWGPDGSVKQPSTAESNIYDHFLECDQQQLAAGRAQCNPGAGAQQTFAAGGGIYACFDDSQQQSAPELDLYAAFADS